MKNMLQKSHFHNVKNYKIHTILGVAKNLRAPIALIKDLKTKACGT